jgi:hypothetical protein
MSSDGYRAAAQIFEKAVSLFPAYALLHAGLADAYLCLASWGQQRPREAFAKARWSALQALNIDSLLPHAYSSLAAVTAFYEWEWEKGIGLARKAKLPKSDRFPWD